jgi:hypothetical protein
MRNFERAARDPIEDADSLSGYALSLVSEDDRYRLAILAEVEKIRIVVPVFPWAALVSLALAHDDALRLRQNEGTLDSTQGESRPERSALRYLCSLYETQYRRVYYATLAVEAPSLLRERVLAAIAAVYPRLSGAAEELAAKESSLRNQPQ